MLFLTFLCDSCVLPNGTKSNVGNLNISILFLKSVLFPSQKEYKGRHSGDEYVSLKTMYMLLAFLIRSMMWHIFQTGKIEFKCPHKNLKISYIIISID